MTAEVLAFLGGAPGPISLFEAWEEAVPAGQDGLLPSLSLRHGRRPSWPAGRAP